MVMQIDETRESSVKAERGARPRLFNEILYTFEN